jgi:integrase
LEPEEEQRLLRVAPEPLRSLILLDVHTGLRIQAVALTLKWASVDLKRGTLTVKSAYAKNCKTRSVPLNSMVRATLEQLQGTATGEMVFTCGDVGKKFRAACVTAKLKGVTPHTLRHTFASRLVMSGADLRTIQELGGWQTIGMVERYSHLTGEHKANAIERLAIHYGIPTSPREAVGEGATPSG